MFDTIKRLFKDEEDRKAKIIKVPLKTLENGHIPVLEEVFTDYANKNLHKFTELLRKVDANQSELTSISDVHAKIVDKDLANRDIMILECRVNSIDGRSRGFTWWSYAKMQENANNSVDDIKAAHKIIDELVLDN